MTKAKVKVLHLLSVAFSLLTLVGVTGCDRLPKAEAEAQTRNPRTEGASATPVDVAIARAGVLQESPTFIGTTQPAGEVSLRSRVEGRLLNLSVDSGDRVAQGQIIAQIDDALLRTAVTQAQAELAARESEVARAKTQVNNARARAEQARVELQQAKNDSTRRQFLSRQGAISKQEAELAQTAVGTGEQALRAAVEQIRTEQQAVAAAQGRVAAQRAVIAELRERLSYARIASPINGIVIQRVSEPGNLVQPGGEILKIGDFSRVKVVVPLSELELSNVRVGQSVQVRLDAFPNQTFSGTVARISPAADVSARQIPVEITIPNVNGQIGSGLLARVNFAQQSQQRVLVPQTAFQAGGGQRGGRGNGESGRAANSPNSSPGKRNSAPSAQASPSTENSASGTIFVVTGEGNETKVSARPVQLGDRANGRVEILSGLQPGERYVVRSGKPLKDGETVRLSILSEGLRRSGSQVPTQENNAQPKGQQ